MRMLVRSSLVALTLMWMTGDVSGIGDTLLQSASFVNEMQFSRGMEREADAFAIAEMQRQGRSLAQMAAIYRALAQALNEKRPMNGRRRLAQHPSGNAGTAGRGERGDGAAAATVIKRFIALYRGTLL